MVIFKNSEMVEAVPEVVSKVLAMVPIDPNNLHRTKNQAAPYRRKPLAAAPKYMRALLDADGNG